MVMLRPDPRLVMPPPTATPGLDPRLVMPRPMLLPRLDQVKPEPDIWSASFGPSYLVMGPAAAPGPLPVLHDPERDPFPRSDEYTLKGGRAP
jgi:hypothetical protein